MKNAVSYLLEPLLTQFFLIDAICQGFIGENERLETFKKLARVFCVPFDETTKSYFEAASTPQYKDIADRSSYERLCRIIEFAEKRGESVGMTAIDRVILAQKREAMQIKSELFKQSKNLTADIIAGTLLDNAMNGSVAAMTTLSYMEYHGLCICLDRESALKRIRLCAKWNSVFGNLMGIAYDPPGRSAYYNTLYTVLHGSNQKEAFKYVCNITGYGDRCTKDPIASIIEKAFGLCIVRRNAYDRGFAKVAFSELISVEDKEKLLLSKKKDAIASLSDIPFDVSRERKLTFEREKARRIPLDREDELHRVLCGISPATNNRPELYRTLLVACDDEYVSEMYAEALRAGFEGGNRVIEVDASTLAARDFAGAKENFILRGLSETKQSHTVFFIKHCDGIGEDELEELVRLLDYEYRRRFKLLEPTVSLDLSEVLIVLFSSEISESVRRLSEECDTVFAKRLGEEEKQTVIDRMFVSRSSSYGIGRARLEEKGKEYLTPFGTEQIERILDGALKKAAYDNETVITFESLKTVSAQQNITVSKREFGYLGGVFHEEY